MDKYTNERIDDGVNKTEAYTAENELRKTIQRQKKTIFRLAERNRVWKIICAVMLVVIVIESMVLWINTGNEGVNVPTTTAPEDVITEDIVTTETQQQVDVYENRINELMSEMTLNDKIYHMIFATPEALTGYDNVTAAGEATKSVLSEKKVGGLIYNSTNFETKEQVTDMMANVKSYFKISPFIATVEDSEAKSELSVVKSDEDYKLPTISDIASYDSVDKMVEEYYKSGQSMVGFGFNTNCSGAQGMSLDDVDTSIVASVSGCAINGYSKSGISSMVKYFPTNESSEKNIDQLKMREFEVFKTLIASDVDMIVLSNGINKNFIGEEIAYSMSNVTYDTLRKNLGFKGIIVSNAFCDENITEKFSASEIVIKSINSGCNMFLCTNNFDNIVTAVSEAVESGEIQQSTIDECIKKILAVKLKREIVK